MDAHRKIVVEISDLSCLDDGNAITGHILDSAMNLKVHPLDPDGKIFLFSTLFYSTLTQVTLNEMGDGYARVSSWTKHVNLFEKEYLLIPIHKDFHWFLVVVCNPGF